jgi:hypothetical protein
MKGCIPVRLSAFHMCHPPAFFSMVPPVLKMFMGERLRKHIQLHSGNKEQVLKCTSKFGLPRDAIPSELGGDAPLDHADWLERRRAAGL